MFSQNVKYNLLKYSLLQFCLHPHPVHCSGNIGKPPMKIVIAVIKMSMYTNIDRKQMSAKSQKLKQDPDQNI